MKSTTNGKLNPLTKCTITIPSAGDIINPPPNSDNTRNRLIDFTKDGVIELNNLPDISDSKSAVYNGEGIIGRSSPLHTYSHSAERTIGLQLHFFITEPGDASKNLRYLRAIQSAVYPREGDNTPFKPPPICRIKCGDLLGREELCVILQNYSVKFPTEVAWDEQTYCPYRFDVDTNWIVVYTTNELPFQSRILTSGR